MSTPFRRNVEFERRGGRETQSKCGFLGTVMRPQIPGQGFLPFKRLVFGLITSLLLQL